MNLTLVKSSLPYLIVLMGVFGAVNNLTAQKLPSGYHFDRKD
ncbi:hypothetical protein B879_01597 [Cecembia lonarensis LW9]|uniref:Uncharacterized protein n=1 Tax=Cecembia lonarensis (strain CCUG 58316 / KCTC 22772 / LW9) TaxID=1225176 RepID=K1M0G2_CECL9|nr:hypothetical protein B879_01597 [Cecembia lonarensis LW9]